MSTPTGADPFAAGVKSFPPPIETARLLLRPMHPRDADFVIELLNDPDFLRHIGDKGVRSGDDARRYVRDGPVASYGRHGFGLLVVERKAGGEAVGICGLLKRDALEHADVGFALLPGYRSRGYALEAAEAVIADARRRLGLRRLLAVTSPDNEASIGLLGKLGFRFERLARLVGSEPEVRVFALGMDEGDRGEPAAGDGAERAGREEEEKEGR